MNRLQNRSLNKDSKKNNKGCISGILGTLCVIGGMLVFNAISSLLFHPLITGARLGDEVACALMTNSLTSVVIAFVLYEAIFIVWQIKLSRTASGITDEKGTMKRVLIWVFIGCIVLSLAVAVFFSNTYTELREDSISKVFITTTKEYRWDERNDVLRYTCSCDNDGVFSYKVIMKDGESFELLNVKSSAAGIPQPSFAAYPTGSFKEKYSANEIHLFAYIAHLSSQFDSSDYYIEKKITGIENMEKYYKEPYPEIWAEISKIIASEIEE